MGFCCSAICGFQGRKAGGEWWKICWLCGGVILCYYRYYVAAVVSQLVVLPCGNHNRFYHPTARKMVKNGFCTAALTSARRSEHSRTFNLHPHDAHLSNCIITPSSTAPTSLQHDDGWKCARIVQNTTWVGGGWKNAELCDKFSLHTVVVVLAKLSGNFLCNFSSNYIM